MVTLYTWIPLSPAEAIALRVLPDIGHSALEVNVDGQDPVYISYWPETESVIATVTSLLKPREARFPVSYAEESDYEAGFMIHGGKRGDRGRRGLKAQVRRISVMPRCGEGDGGQTPIPFK